MNPDAPFTWLDSKGWIVLSGPPDALSEIRAQALSRYDGAGALAYISLAPDLGDALMDDMAELGAPAGYLVDLEDPDNNEVYQRLSAAGMIVIEACRQPDRLHALMSHTVASALKSALELGALILFEGAAATLAGQHRMTAGGELTAGLNFVGNALIATIADNEAESTLTRNIHRQLSDISILGLARGSALALGPDRRLETWGDGEVTISLGESALPDRDHNH
ncbi:MAG: hypothetical protein OXI30_10200 [Chloroflexota bacterium]|nr:hypothetical protein [Chloroflexota bacterium]